MKLKTGNELAFREIFTQWERPLFYYLCRITGSQQDAEDICQETFAALWLHRDSVDPAKNIKTYIFLIARQITWKHFRANKRRQGFISDFGANGSSDSVSPESIIQAQEIELLTELAINKLPRRTREMYNLYYKENLSYEQIARMLDTNAVNVKSQIYQARQKIREVITTLVAAFFS